MKSLLYVAIISLILANTFCDHEGKFYIINDKKLKRYLAMNLVRMR